MRNPQPNDFYTHKNNGEAVKVLSVQFNRAKLSGDVCVFLQEEIVAQEAKA
ncbi:hypothetical protein ACT2XF_000050 [Providencia rettgeri]